MLVQERRNSSASFLHYPIDMRYLFQVQYTGKWATGHPSTGLNCAIIISDGIIHVITLQIDIWSNKKCYKTDIQSKYNWSIYPLGHPVHVSGHKTADNGKNV